MSVETRFTHHRVIVVSQGIIYNVPPDSIYGPLSDSDTGY